MSPDEPQPEDIIVEAGPDSVEAIASLARDFHADDGYFDEAVFRKALLELLTSDPPLGRVLLAREAGRVSGYAVLTLGYSLEFGGKDSFIDELYVAPSHRGRGLGRGLLRGAEGLAQSLGVRAIHLEVDDANEEGLSLYRSSGFRHRGYRLMTKYL